MLRRFDYRQLPRVESVKQRVRSDFLSVAPHPMTNPLGHETWACMWVRDRDFAPFKDQGIGQPFGFPVEKYAARILSSSTVSAARPHGARADAE